MSRSFIQIKNKDSIYTISTYKNDNCKRTKKRPLRFFVMLKKTILALTKRKFGDTLFGNSRSWKRSQGQITKKY